MRSTTSAEPGLDSPLGRYRLIALLGQGGMADVYLAATQGAGGFQKLLVVKLARFTGDPVFATMFLSEARLAAQLSHPNIVQTFEIGEEGTRHYIVMEYLDGGNFARLRQKMVKQGGIPLRISLNILLHVLEALEYAHEAVGLDGKPLKVVHRDLSPSNIMVTAQGVVKILDFGIAKAADSASFTQTGKFSGKLEYMPPEQLRGERVDARADIFSFGVMLAESFLGEKLWGGSAGPKIAAELGAGKIPSLDRGIEVDPELRRIVEKALDPDREKRYASAAEMKTDLAAFVATLGAPVSQRELADFVRKTVEDDRAKLQAVIDNQLQRISLLSWGGETPPPDLPRLETTPSGVQGATIKDEMVVEDSDKVSVITKEREGKPAETVRPVMKSSKLPLFLIGGGALAAIAVIVFIAMGRGEDAKPQDTTPAGPPPAAAPATVRVEIIASPPEAAFTLDGKALVGNPYVGSYAKDSELHELTVTADGYRSLTQRFALDRDASFHLSLTKAAPPVATTTEPTEAPKPPPTTASTISSRATAPARVTTSSRKSSRKNPPQPAATITPPGTPAVTATTAPPPIETKPADTKRTLDNGVYDSKSSKRSLDSNVLDSGSNKPKPSLDRDNPWKN